MELTNLIDYLFRWIHFFAGVTWIGLLYYFNFVQTEYFKEAGDAKTNAIDKLVPRALWWFRWGAMFTFLSGLALAGFIEMQGVGLNYYILLGMTLGTLMFLNVWLIIWPNQQIVIASNRQVLDGGEPLAEAAVAQGKAGLASRSNTLFSLPMLFFMGASAHLGGVGRVPITLEGSASMIAIVLTLLIVALLEFNAIKGKTGPITSVSGVIHSSVWLTAALVLIVEFL
ncbi:MAG: urate hydroxylase PuuD [Gammaproteobacteria bacterium]|nr:urate hydroxylase PuuD [Gammaproteobacteria bacterium]MCY3689325.1 urate hydroxylase PuuD [Gammaproteobacteria bacterium]MDE0479066.1 urate hydroxylase PuuD [Gammaproteobacteria bacterium]